MPEAQRCKPCTLCAIRRGGGSPRQAETACLRDGAEGSRTPDLLVAKSMCRLMPDGGSSKLGRYGYGRPPKNPRRLAVRLASPEWLRPARCVHRLRGGPSLRASAFSLCRELHREACPESPKLERARRFPAITHCYSRPLTFRGALTPVHYLETSVLTVARTSSALRASERVRRPRLPRSAVLLEPRLRGDLGRRSRGPLVRGSLGGRHPTTTSTGCESRLQSCTGSSSRPGRSTYTAIRHASSLPEGHARRRLPRPRTSATRSSGSGPARTATPSRPRRFGRIHDVILVLLQGRRAGPGTRPTTPYDPRLRRPVLPHVEDDDGAALHAWRPHRPQGASGQPSSTTVTGVDAVLALFPRRAWTAPHPPRPRVLTKPGTVPQYKRYLDEMQGTCRLQDVWTDIEASALLARRAARLSDPEARGAARAHHPREQQPRATSSSTRSVAAVPPSPSRERLGRQWIGIDISPTAVDIMKRRVLKVTQRRRRGQGRRHARDRARAAASSSRSSSRTGSSTRFIGTHSPRKIGDMGIDGYSFLYRRPDPGQAVRRVGRDVVDNVPDAVVRTHRQATTATSSRSPSRRGAYEEAARAKSDGLEITLVTVKTLLDGASAAPLRDRRARGHTRGALCLLTRARLPRGHRRSRREHPQPQGGASPPHPHPLAPAAPRTPKGLSAR